MHNVTKSCIELTGPFRGQGKQWGFNVTDGGKSVKINKGAHHEKDGFGGSGLRGRYGGDLDAVNVLDPLLVPVQDENCGTTGPDHDHKTDHIREGQQCCK